MKTVTTMTFATVIPAALAPAETRHATLVKAAGAAGRGRRIRSNQLGFTLVYVTHSKEEMIRIGQNNSTAQRQGGRSMKWITREKVKVDRVACPWLIKKFVDPDAEFGFLPHDTDWASVHDATVYDVPGCELGHHGEEVSFDAILRKYGLTDPALALLAQIVRAADSHPSGPHPAGEGLRWIAHGFSALGLNDHEILDREFIVYDALFAECRKRVVA